ncbi:MAG: 3D domain-containing protein [Candidatus Eremiobacteraeota bacterium]|nr:3D domain-containing protein [Candidatus Eremiobacteraeota bacterium]
MTTGVLSLGLLIPFGAGTVPDQIAKKVAHMAAPAPAKHITFVHDGLTETIDTSAETAADFLAERNLSSSPDDALSVDPASPLTDGETVVYRAAVLVTVTIDGQSRILRTPAANVSALLFEQGVAFDRHDRVSPAPPTALVNGTALTVHHVDTWTETIRKPVAAKVVKRFAFTMPPGKTQVLDAGTPGVAETAYAVTRTPDRRTVRRTALVSRILRAPRARIVAEGIGEYAALSQLAERGITGTLKLASSALSMVATAYTAGCGGCSGITATGRPAGHGIVAVDPRVIPLGTRMYIPGYGHAVAGDTGGAIRGNRIDLGFNSNYAANQFGRRAITVYLIK